jgi:uncharacterized protein YfeS
MKFTFTATFLASIFWLGCSNGQTNQGPIAPVQQKKTMDNFEFTFKSAHPDAQALMKDDFYWSAIEETAPFGSDDGSDAAYGFRQWRQVNKKTSPVIYLNELIARWEYPYFNYNEMDSSKIKEYIASTAIPNEADIEQKMKMMREALKNSADTAMRNVDDKELRDIVTRSSQQLGGAYLLGQDNAIIGTGFAQFVLEGHVDNDIKALTITAIKRQLLPVLISRYDDVYRQVRTAKLTRMLEVMNKAGL